MALRNGLGQEKEARCIGVPRLYGGLAKGSLSSCNGYTET